MAPDGKTDGHEQNNMPLPLARDSKWLPTMLEQRKQKEGV